jgi:hypothetical protein
MWRNNVKTMLRLHDNAFNTDWTLKVTCWSTILTECIVATKVTLYHGRVYTLNNNFAKASQFYIMRTFPFVFIPNVSSSDSNYNEQNRKWKEAVVFWFGVLAQNLSGATGKRTQKS